MARCLTVQTKGTDLFIAFWANKSVPFIEWISPLVFVAFIPDQAASLDRIPVARREPVLGNPDDAATSDTRTGPWRGPFAPSPATTRCGLLTVLQPLVFPQRQLGSAACAAMRAVDFRHTVLSIVRIRGLPDAACKKLLLTSIIRQKTPRPPDSPAPGPASRTGRGIRWCARRGRRVSLQRVGGYRPKRSW